MNYLTQCLAALAAAAVLAACGGGEADGHAYAAVLPAPGSVDEAPGPVQLEGCIVDAQGRPLAQAVHATDADGRLLASALSDAAGVYRLQVPARRAMHVAVVPGSDALAVLTGASPVTIAGCLRAAA